MIPFDYQPRTRIVFGPDKIEQLKAANVSVVGRIPIVIPANSHDEGYLEVKRRKMGHMM